MSGIRFWRIHGCGNSFILVHKKDLSQRDRSLFAKKVCQPGFGMAADGLMVVSKDESTLAVDMYNPDGSSMGMCGNGVRCVYRFAVLEGLIDPETERQSLSTGARTLEAVLKDGARSVRVCIGAPTHDHQEIPCTQSMINTEFTFEDRGEKITLRGTAVSVGNPHCVIFVDNVNEIPLEWWGPLIEHHPLFPKRVNVEFAEILSNSSAKVRVWERGAGVTLACGSGACATVVAGATMGQLAQSSTVSLPGGDLRIDYDTASNLVYLEGPTQEVCVGELVDI